MRKKIQNLAYARFQYEKPIPRFSVEELEFEVQQEEIYKGSFSLNSINGSAMRGMVYSSSSRMECLTPEFDGTDVTISFEFHSGGLKEGDVEKGEFTIICDGGEYVLPFVVRISGFYVMSSIGRIKNLFDFANLAHESYEEAFRIFRAPSFLRLLKETERKERLLYWGLGMQNARPQGMEEFLIGIRKKQRVVFFIEEAEQEFWNVREDTRGIIRVRKEHWGYIELFVRSDNPAIVPVKNKITTDDFVGNFVEIEFIIRREGLHSGNNYGRIILEGLKQREICEIVVSRKHPQEAKENQSRVQKRKEQLLKLTQLYLDYRRKHIVTGVWARESGDCLDCLQELEPENLWYELYRAQTLLMNKQRQEAEWILDDFRKRAVEKDSPLYGYYLYLLTLQEKEPSYVAKLLKEISRIYQQNKEDIRMFLLMLFADSQMNQSRSRKLSAIAEKVEQGMQSPILYMEASSLIKNDVFLLEELGDFQRRVLFWAAKEGELTPKISSQICQYAGSIRQYHRMWYEILTACYQVYPEKEMLKTICAFCIKWNLFSEKYFSWYDRGIREELPLAGLYEAWMESAGSAELEHPPKSVLLYFQYQSNLNDKKQAMLYAAILQNKSNPWSLYEAYEKKIRHFTIEQLLAGHIDENLAFLYEELLKNQPINKELSDALAEVLYAHRLISEDSHAVKVVVLHYERKGEQQAAFVNQQALVQLYSSDNCILFENGRGIRYIPDAREEIKPLLLKERYVKDCVAANGNQLSHLVHYFEGRKTSHTFQTEDMPRLLLLMESEHIRQEYKRELKPQMIEYYHHFYTGEELDTYLKQVDYDGLKRSTGNQLIELMIARGIYDKAYEMLRTFGCEQVTVSKLILVAVNRIRALDGGWDKEVLRLCSIIFRRGKYNETILRYLCKYFEGNVKELEQLWKAAREFDLDTFALEERFLVQLLYTESGTGQMDDIFQSYFDARGQEVVILAYLTYFSHQYFVKDMVLSEKFFSCIMQQLFLKNPMNDSCKLACFRWLTESKKNSRKQEELMEELLSEYLKREMYFAFYQRLPERLLIKYHLYDRSFLEYRTNPGVSVSISYSLDGENFQEEPMRQMYEGIFTKPFVLFFGESIPYYIKEKKADDEIITESGYVTVSDSMSLAEESSYAMLNDIMISYHMKDMETLKRLYEQYQQLEHRVEEAFQLL